MKMLVAGRIFLAIRIFSEHEIFYESFVLQEPSIEIKNLAKSKYFVKTINCCQKGCGQMTVTKKNLLFKVASSSTLEYSKIDL